MTTLAPAPADVLLADGSVAVIRPLRQDDADALHALHDRASDDSLRLRFFAVGRRAADQYVEHLRQDPSTLALVATVRGRVVALGTAEDVSPGEAEVAFLVDDTLRGHGLGSLLLEHLAAAGRNRGITRFRAEVLAENYAMTAVFRDAGFTSTRRSEEGVTYVEMDTVASSRAVAAADDREGRAEARSLEPLLHPASIALAGVKRDGTGVGAAVLGSVRAGGFTGPVHVIHPKAGTVLGTPASPRFVDVPEHVDLAVISVPAENALAALQDAADARVGAAVVISSGFQEMGPRGAGLERQMAELARDRSIRLVGPNCLGVMSNRPDVRLNATFSDVVPKPGGLAVATQSGGVGIVLLDVARRLGLGLSCFVSLGNKADVSSNDLLAAWWDDPEVTAAALYLESFGNAPKFARFARRFAERKPLLAVVGGRSAGGRRAGASHTAAAAATGVGVDALFAQSGVIGCRGAEEMTETALLLAEQPRPAGRRLAVLSNAGGIGVLAADLADGAGLVVPELSATLRAEVAARVSGTIGTGNPIDAGAGAAPRDLAAVAGMLLDSGEVDMLLVALVATGVTDARMSLEMLGETRREHPGKPMVLVPMGGLEVAPGALPGITTFGTNEAAVGALARVQRYVEWLGVPHGIPEPTEQHQAATARALATELLAAGPEGGHWLDPAEARSLLEGYGLTPNGLVASDAVGAAQVAEEIGFPVVLKVADPAVVHKTDRGLVRVGLQSTAEVMSAVRAFGDELGREDAEVLVQPVITGPEIALGLVQDPGFGPLVMVAAGGVATELWNDRVFLMPPLTRADAARALRGLRVWPMLEGYRGAPPVDVAALEDLIVALGRLASDVPQVAELDLNPVVATPAACFLVDVKVRLAPAVAVSIGVPRQLRQGHPAPG